MKRWICMVLSLCLILALCACGGEAPDASPAGTLPPESETPADSLSAFRAEIKPPIIAVANFGFPSLSDNLGIQAYLTGEYPTWMESHDFIRAIPQERTVLTCGYGDWGNLVCVVPRDPLSAVTVIVMTYLDQEPYVKETVAYQSNTGEPIFLLASTDENVLITVKVTDREGRGVSWNPYWGNANPIPEDSYSGALVMDFTPLPENFPGEGYLDGNRHTPDATELAMTVWESGTGYALEFYYQPGQMYDGIVNLYTMLPDGSYEPFYCGSWIMNGSNIDLDMVRAEDGNDAIQDSFPILMEPGDGTWLWIGTGETGTLLPFTGDASDGTELYKAGTVMEAVSYDTCIANGCYAPELHQLADTFWLSELGYALELTDNSVAGDSEGWAKLYDVGPIGEYTESYTGSWIYEDGYLYLSLVPLNGDGYLVDESFPVLLEPYGEARLFIGRSENGIGLPHFHSGIRGDKLEQPKG